MTRDELMARFRERFAARDYLKALQDCRDLLEQNPRDAVAWRNMAAIYIALGSDADAAQTAGHALDLDPKDPWVHYYLGVIDARADRHDEAIHRFEQALSLNRGMGEAHQGLASAHYRLGDDGNAVFHWSQAYQLAPQSAEICRGFGATLLRMGQPAKAVYYLRQAVDLLPDWAEARQDYGEALRLAGEDRDAVTELLRGLRIKQRPEGLVSLSLIHLKYREPRKALVHLQRAIELGPTHAPAYHTLGLVHGALKDWVRALEAQGRAYAIAPDNTDYALAYAEALVNAGGNLEHAFRLAAAVRIKDPSRAKAYDILGWCLFREGKAAEAREELERARAILEVKERPDADDAAIYEHLAEVYSKLDDGMMSREMYARAGEIDPQRRAEWQKRAGSAANS